MERNLCFRRTLEDIEKEARNLLHDLRRREITAVQEYYLRDPLAGAFHPRLSDAQYIVARRYGYKSWQRLKECRG